MNNKNKDEKNNEKKDEKKDEIIEKDENKNEKKDEIIEKDENKNEKKDKIIEKDENKNEKKDKLIEKDENKDEINFYILCPEDLIYGNLLTKETRHKIFGKVSGNANSIKPENYQREKIISITGYKCIKTNIRINLRNHTLENISQPNKNINGFDYSENFDGYQSIKNKKIYINFKCIVGKGGSQTRSLREVYWFIEGQLNLLLNNNDNIYFANILDGDESHNCMTKFEYLINLPEYKNINDKVYIGNLKNYFNYLNNLFN